MQKRTKRIVALAVAGVCLFVGWRLVRTSTSDHETAGTKRLVNQVWIERMPEDSRDIVTHFVVLKHPQGRFGAVGASSQWRHMVEVFQWKLDGKRLTTFFPQDRVRARVDVETWQCKGEAPEPFELCLRVSSGDRSVVLYSRDEWRVRPHEVEASLREIEAATPELAGSLVEPTLPAAEADESDAVDLPEGSPLDSSEIRAMLAIEQLAKE
jgi:hypothetical protein